jgi:hypothetical protein
MRQHDDLLGLVSFFEVFYAPAAFDKPLPAAFYLTSVMTLSTSQASALALILKAYGRSSWPVATVALAVVAMGLLYWGFWRSKRSHVGTTAIVAPVPQ